MIKQADIRGRREGHLVQSFVRWIKNEKGAICDEKTCVGCPSRDIGIWLWC